MLKITFGYAITLIVLGFAFFGYVQWRDGAGAKGATALIPAYVGGVAFIVACLAIIPKWRMHAMHVAVLIGLLGVLAGVMGVVTLVKWFGGAEVRALAMTQQLILGGISLAFVFACVRSFIAARRARKALQATASLK